MKKAYRFSFILALFLFSQWCFAFISPADQLQTVANKMIVQLESNKAHLENMSVIRHIVNQVLMPNIDLDRMASAVVGRNWRTTTGAQRATFKKEFAELVTNTYASALSSYNGDQVIFQPMRGNTDSQQTTRVSSVIVRKNGQRIPISYDVERNGSQWKVYDFSIEHVSMVQSYYSQFQSVLAQGGMSELLARLKNHNQSRK